MDTNNERLLLLWRLYWHTLLKVGSIILSQMCKDWGKIWWRWQARGEEDNRERDDWMTSANRWTRVWARCGRRWRTGKPGALQSMGRQRVSQDVATEQQQDVWRLCAIILQRFYGSQLSVEVILSDVCVKLTLTHVPCYAPHLAQNTMRFISSLNFSLLCSTPNCKRASPAAQTVRNLPVTQGTQVWSLVG